MGYYNDRDGDTIWLADSEGFGWFALIIILILPLFIAGIFISSLAVWITEHLFAAGGIFLFINICVSFLFSMKYKNMRMLIMDLAANIILFQTIFLTAILYGIPYIINGESWWDVFELIIVEVFNVGVLILIKAIGKLHSNAGISLATALFAGIVYIFLMNHVLKGTMTSKELMQLYHINKKWVFSVCFGVFFIM